MASEDGSGEEDTKVADMQVDKPEIEAETNPNHNQEDSEMAEKEEQGQENDSEKAKEMIENETKKVEEEEEQEQQEEGNDAEEKISKKGNEVKTPVSKKRKVETREATIERPSRERKTVERYTETALARGSATKPFSIEKVIY